MTRILYHLGMPKTGTSLLQGTMARAAADLRPHGVLYPKTARGGSAHHALTEILRDGGSDMHAAFRADLAAEIAAARAGGPDVRLALISSEGLTNLCGTDHAADFAGFMADPGQGLRGTAVIFLREMTSFFESMYFQTTRFRAISGNFDTYLIPRPKWMQSFLGGLTIIKDRMGDDFEIVLAGKGYDVLRAFETRLSLPDRFLDAPSRDVGSTARPSLKSQTAMVHLDWVEAQIGFQINRRVFSRILGEERVFANDVPSFTIYAPGQRNEVAKMGIALMEEAGFHDYAALTRALPPQTLPHHVIDRALLTADDVAAVAALRPLIEQLTEADVIASRDARRAARQALRVRPAARAGRTATS